VAFRSARRLSLNVSGTTSHQSLHLRWCLDASVV
jgi:hypothetical protein